MFLVDGVATEDDIWSDRGLAYGDGVFETLAWDAGRLLAWSSHVERLRRGCEMLGIPPPQDRRLREECLAVARSMPKAVVKVIVTRGVGGRGYRPPLAAVPRRIVAAHPWPNDIGSTQTRTWICAQPVSINPSTAGIKHLNRLDQVLASREWPGDDYFEGLMLDPSGLLIEGTRSNVFVVHEGVVATPDLAQCGVKGIVRNAVIACCHRTGVDVFEAPLSVNGLTAADEVFICNSIIGVRPVTAVECPQEIRFQPGPITGRIADALRSDGVIV